jgi:hypothetical protein
MFELFRILLPTLAALFLKLQDLGDTWGSISVKGVPSERTGSCKASSETPSHPQACRGGVWECCQDMSVLRHQPQLLLQVAGALPRTRRRRTSGPLEEAAELPFAIQDDVIGRVIYLRQHYHFGPLKIVMYLKRYYDVTVSNSGVWRVLRHLGMNRLPAYRRYTRQTERWKLYEQPQPGHRVQVDVKFISPLKGSRKRNYQYTAVGDCTRLRVLRLYTRANQKTSIQFIDYVLQRLPFTSSRLPHASMARLSAHTASMMRSSTDS